MGNQFKAIMQKKNVFLYGILRTSKILNILKLLLKYFLKLESLKTYPILLKIDVTPNCQLKCPVCIHGADDVELQKQDFKNKEMELDLFMRLADEVSGKTLAFSLYHLGEPLLNKNIYKMISYASSKNINCYFTSNFSLKLSDKEIELMVESGVRQITVALDGFSQENYSKTRVNGNVEFVKNNLERVVKAKNKIGIKNLWITVQTCIFEHNKHEISLIEEFCKKIGIDDHRSFPGTVEQGGWVKIMMPRVTPKKKQKLPICKWPHFASVVLYNGDVIPCCQYRNDNAYSVEQETIKMGSVNNGSFGEVFNGERYLLARKMMRDPGVQSSKAKENFCYQCPVIFN